MTESFAQSEPTCAAARDAWHAALDGELTPADQERLDAHLAACAACRAYTDELGAIAGALAELRVVSGRVGMPAGQPVARRRAAWLRGGSRIAAAVALLLGAGAITYLARDEGEVGPVPTPRRVAAPPAESDGAPAAIPVEIVLAGESDDRFIPVAQSTARTNVHVFILFERP